MFVSTQVSVGSIASKDRASLIEITDSSRVQAILDAVCSREIEGVKTLHGEMKTQGEPVPIQTMAQVAAVQGDANMLQHLLDEGAVFDRTLWHATSLPTELNAPLVKLLIRQGWLKRCYGLSVQIHRGPEVLKVALDHGAIVSPGDLRQAAIAGDVEALEILFSKFDNRRKIERIEYETRDADAGSRPDLFTEPDSRVRIMNEGGLLQVAAARSQLDMIRHLLAEGADPNFTPFTDFHWDHRECMNGPPLDKALFFLSHGHDPNVEVVKALIDAGANPRITNQEGIDCFEKNRRWNTGPTRNEIERIFQQRDECGAPGLRRRP